MDSFAVRTLRDLAHMTRLRGAETVSVGIQPEVAFAMVQLGLTLKGVATALDLEDGHVFPGRPVLGASPRDAPRVPRHDAVPPRECFPRQRRAVRALDRRLSL